MRSDTAEVCTKGNGSWQHRISFSLSSRAQETRPQWIVGLHQDEHLPGSEHHSHSRKSSKDSTATPDLQHVQGHCQSGQ